MKWVPLFLVLAACVGPMEKPHRDLVHAYLEATEDGFIDPVELAELQQLAEEWVDSIEQADWREVAGAHWAAIILQLLSTPPGSPGLTAEDLNNGTQETTREDAPPR